MPASTQQSTETDGAGGAAGFDGIVARISLTDGASRIDFDYNPQSVAMSRRSKAHDQANGQVAMAETGLKVAGNLMLTLTKCRFVGANLESRMVQLLNWGQWGRPAPVAPPSRAVPPWPGSSRRRPVHRPRSNCRR
jgi:hypothetical protein